GAGRARRRRQGRAAPRVSGRYAARAAVAYDARSCRRRGRRVCRQPRPVLGSLNVRTRPGNSCRARLSLTAFRLTRGLGTGVASALLAGCATLFAACALADTPEADADYRYPDGSTPLMWAVYENDVERVVSLIAAGADVNAANDYGANAMQLAAEGADVELLRMLLDAGADVDSPNPEGQTALMLVARTGKVDAAKLLVERGAAVDARERWGEQTALMWASVRRHPEMVDYLIREGADINARS